MQYNRFESTYKELKQTMLANKEVTLSQVLSLPIRN